MEIKKHDFIEIDFTGKIKDGEVFDSTSKEELEKLHQGHDHPIEAKPLIFCLGHGMFLDALDDFLVGKETGKTYEVELPPEKSFGQRDSKLVQMIPIDIFKKQKINPIPGYSLNFDGRVGKILTVSGGRVMVDFNHSLSGKTVDYQIKVLRIVTDINEKIKALNDFFFRREFKSDVNDKKLVIYADKQMARIVPLFADKFKEILNLDLEVKEESKEEEIGEKNDNPLQV